jgi:hypothetical protein
MDKRRGAIGADQLDAAVEEKIAEQRRKDADKSECHERFGIERDRAAAGELQNHRRQEQRRAQAHADCEKRKRMHGRPLAQVGRIEPIRHERNHETDVATIELNAEQRGEAAGRDDDEDAGERDADAAGLPRRETVAEQREGPHSDEQRTDRLQEQSVNRGRELQTVVGHGVVDREPYKRDQRQ